MSEKIVSKKYSSRCANAIFIDDSTVAIQKDSPIPSPLLLVVKTKDRVFVTSPDKSAAISKTEPIIIYLSNSRSEEDNESLFYKVIFTMIKKKPKSKYYTLDKSNHLQIGEIQNNINIKPEISDEEVKNIIIEANSAILRLMNIFE